MLPIKRDSNQGGHRKDDGLIKHWETPLETSSDEGSLTKLALYHINNYGSPARGGTEGMI